MALMEHRKACPLFYFLTDLTIQVFSIYNSNAYLQKICQHDRVLLKYENSSHAPALTTSHTHILSCISFCCNWSRVQAAGLQLRQVCEANVITCLFKKKAKKESLPKYPPSKRVEKSFLKQPVYFSLQKLNFPGCSAGEFYQKHESLKVSY